MTSRSLLNSVLTASSLCISLVSCNNISHVLVYQHSNVGFCSGLNPQTNNIHVRLGVRQETAALIPKIDHEKLEDGTKAENPDAASTYVAMRVNVDHPFATPEVNELIATGQAAVNVASDKDPMKPFNEKNPKSETGN